MNTHKYRIFLFVMALVASTGLSRHASAAPPDDDHVRVYVDEDTLILSGLVDQVGVRGAIVFRIRTSSALGAMDRDSQVSVRLFDSSGNVVASDVATFSPGIGSTVAIELTGTRSPGTYRLECVGDLYTVHADLVRRAKQVRVERQIKVHEEQRQMTVHFPSAEAAPLAAGRALRSGEKLYGLKDFDRMLRGLSNKNQCWNVTILGHADSTGTDEYNIALAEHRARQIYQELRRHITVVNSVETAIRTLGYHDPIASNETDDGRALNRRAEITLEAAPCPK